MIHLLTQALPPFSDYDIFWSVVVQFGIVMSILLLANVLRRRIKWLQGSLLPVAVIGGFIGLFIKYLLSGGIFPGLDVIIRFVRTVEDTDVMISTSLISRETLATFTFHAIAIGFAAITLKGIDRIPPVVNTLKTSATKSGMVIVNSYLLQGILGLVITLLISFLFSQIPAFSGFLLPMAFGQGPGQALNVGNTFANQADFAFGVDLGLSLAAAGFVAASIGGVIYLRKLKRLNLLPEAKDIHHVSEKKTVLEGNGQIPLIDAVDKLTIQIAIIFFVYLLSWGVIYGLEQLIRASEVQFLINNLIGLLYGFNFIIVVFVAMLYKIVTRFLLAKKLMKRLYTNDFMLNRIAGVAFDVMMISSIMAIDIAVVLDGGFLLTLLLLVVIGGIATYQYLRYITSRVYPHYEHEAFLVFYGTMTGTASTGVALLREKDPYFKTPATNDIVLGSSMAIPLGFPLLLFVGIVYQGPLQFIIVLAVLSIIFVVYHFFLTRRRFKKKS
jgi:ESS family glutamate:Na+ symporter